MKIKILKKILIITIIILGILLSINIKSSANEISQDIVKNQRKNQISQLYEDIPMNSDHVYYLVELCYQYKIDPNFILAIIEVESNYNPLAKNKYSSAKGYGQLLNKTANHLAKQINVKDYNHNIHAYDPYLNIQLTVHYIKYLLDQYNNNLIKVLKSYRGKNDITYINKVIKIMDRIKILKYQ